MAVANHIHESNQQHNRRTGHRSTTDLRQLDAHHAYHEVYHACHVAGVGHE